MDHILISSSIPNIEFAAEMMGNSKYFLVKLLFRFFSENLYFACSPLPPPSFSLRFAILPSIAQSIIGTTFCRTLKF